MKNHPDYHYIMGFILVTLGLGLLSGIFPVIEVIVSIICGAIMLLLFCIALGKYLKYRRLNHEAFYGEPDGQIQRSVLDRDSGTSSVHVPRDLFRYPPCRRRDS